MAPTSRHPIYVPATMIELLAGVGRDNQFSMKEPMYEPGSLTVINESEPQRRSMLKFGGALAFAPLITQLTGGTPVGQAVAAGTDASAALQWPTLSRKTLKYRVPAADWQSQALPIGNGRLGAMLFADPDEERIQFNEQSLWGGINNYDNALADKPDSEFDTGMTGFGSYRNFGDVVVTFASRSTPKITAPGDRTAAHRRRESTGRTTVMRAPSGASKGPVRRCGGRSSSPNPSRSRPTV